MDFLNKKFQQELKERYAVAMKAVWGNSQKMIDYCVKQAAVFIPVANNGIAVIDKPHIETDFYFGYSDCGQGLSYEENNERVNHVSDNLAEYFVNYNLRDINEKINMVIRFVMMIAIPCFVGFLVMAKPVLDLLYSGNIEIPARMLMLGSITVVFYCLSTVTNAILQGVNKMSTPVKHGAISLGIHLVGLYIMLIVFKWGIYAVVMGNVIFSLSMCILNAKALVRYAGYRQEFKKTFLLPLSAALVMGMMLLAS